MEYLEKYYIPSFEEAKKCYEIAKNVKEFIEKAKYENGRIPLRY